MLAKQVVENCTERKSEVYIYSPGKLSKLATINSCKLKYCILRHQSIGKNYSQGCICTVRRFRYNVQ
jgi:hypothetical protein